MNANTDLLRKSPGLSGGCRAVQGRCHHRLGDILGLVLCGTLADCDDFSEIEDYGNDNIDFLRKELGFSFANGVPSEDTLDRVLRYLDSNQLEASFKTCLQDIALTGQHIRIDGKELRGTAPFLQVKSMLWCKWSMYG